MPQPHELPPRLSRAQVREIDRRSIEDYHIPGVVLMENAARAVAAVALDMLRGAPNPSALVVCGGGNNGGDGLAVARHLHNRAVAVTLLLAVDPATYRGDAAVNWRIASAMNLPHVPPGVIQIAPATAGGCIIIDALFGTGLHSPPRDPHWIHWINTTAQGTAPAPGSAQSATTGTGSPPNSPTGSPHHPPIPVLAVDLPSGLDCDTGEPLGPACVRATRTVTFVAEKVGFANPRSHQYLGDVKVGDIGCPRELIESVARSFPPT